MANNLQYYSWLWEKTLADVTAQRGEWKNYLDTVARFYKYPAKDQALIHAQRPGAVACAPYTVWNNTFNRYIQKGAKGVALIDESGRTPQLRYVFDVGDTAPYRSNTRPVYLWQLRAEHKEAVLSALDKVYDDVGETLAGTVQAIAKQLAREYYNDNADEIVNIAQGSSGDELDEVRKTANFETLLSISVAYAVMVRCGLQTDEYFDESDFAGISDYSDNRLSNILTLAVSDLSEQILRGVELAVNRHERQKAQERGRADDRTDIHHERGLSDPGLDDKGGAERLPAAETVRGETAGVSAGTPESGVQLSADDGEADAAPAGSGRGGEKPDGADYPAEGGSDGRDGGTESERPDDVGRDHEQHPPQRGGNRAERTDLQLNSAIQENGYEAAEADQRFLSALAGTAIPVSYVDAILRDGGNDGNSAYRIAARAAKDEPLPELAEFLRVEYLYGRYGWGRPSGKGFVFDNREIAAWFDESGIHIAAGKSALHGGHAAVLDWDMLARHIRGLLRDGRYVSRADFDQALDNERVELARDLFDFYRDDMAYMPEEWQSEHGGAPDDVARIKALLDDPDELQGICDRVETDVTRFKYDEHERVWHNPDHLLGAARAALRPPLLFPSGENTIERGFTRFITEDEIDAFLTQSGGIDGKKYRVFSYLLNDHSAAEKAEFLKKEYGHSGGTWSEGDGWHNAEPGKGITLQRGSSLNPDAEVKLTWSAATRRIERLMTEGRFMTRGEMAMLPNYERLMLVRGINDFYAELPDEYARPFSGELNFTYPKETEWDAIREFLDNKERVDGAFEQMFHVYENTAESDRHYALRKEVLESLNAFHAGTYTLFPGVHPYAAEVEAPPVIPRVETPNTGTQLSLFDLPPSVPPSEAEQRERIGRKLRRESERETPKEAGANAPAIILPENAPFLNISDADRARIAEQFARAPRSRDAVNLVREIYGDSLGIPLPQAMKRIAELAAEGAYAIPAEEKEAVATVETSDGGGETSMPETPRILFKLYARKLAKDISGSLIMPFLRDRETMLFEAENEVVDYLNERAESDEYPGLKQALTMPYFRDWFISEILDRTFYDVALSPDVLMENETGENCPDWAKRPAIAERVYEDLYLRGAAVTREIVADCMDSYEKNGGVGIRIEDYVEYFLKEYRANAPAVILPENDENAPFLNISGADRARIAEQFARAPRSRAAVELVREIYGDRLGIPLPQVMKRIAELAEAGAYDTPEEKADSLEEQIRDELSGRGFDVSDELIEEGLSEYNAHGGRGGVQDIADFIENEYLTDEDDAEELSGIGEPAATQSETAVTPVKQPGDTVTVGDKITGKFGNDETESEWELLHFHEKEQDEGRMVWLDDGVNTARIVAYEELVRAGYTIDFSVMPLSGRERENMLMEYEKQFSVCAWDRLNNYDVYRGHLRFVENIYITDRISEYTAAERKGEWYSTGNTLVMASFEFPDLILPRGVITEEIYRDALDKYFAGVEVVEHLKLRDDKVLTAAAYAEHLYESGRTPHKPEFLPSVAALIARAPDYQAYANAEIALEQTDAKRSQKQELRMLLFEGMNLNRNGKRTRLTYEKELGGKYTLYSDGGHPIYKGSSDKEKYWYLVTPSEFLIQIDSRAMIALPSDQLQRIERYHEKAALDFEAQMRDPEKWANYIIAAIVDRIADAETHNEPVRALRQQASERRRAEAAIAAKAKSEAEDAAFEKDIADFEALFSPGVGVKEYKGGEMTTLYEVLAESFKRNEIDVPLRVKGWLNQKLISINVADGRFTAYSWNRTSKRAQPSEGAVAVLNTLSDALHAKNMARAQRAPEEPEPARDMPQGETTAVVDDVLNNFRITDDRLGEGGEKTKYRGNADAIRTLKAIESENRPAAPEEQETLSRYIGWGGIPQAFDPDNMKWMEEYQELSALLTPEEYESARASTLNAHYTRPIVVKAIWEVVERFGFKSGNVLEPSCGVGNFFGLIPDSMRESKLYGVELDSVTARIAQKLYPGADIRQMGFEKTDFSDAFFDLAIGNVPFGQFGVIDKRYEKQHFNIHSYFFAKSLDKVRPGGIVVFITSSFLMDGKNPKVRKYLAERAELIDAVRLPIDAFLKNAGTETTMDILFLKKRDRPRDIEPDWVHLGLTEDGISLNRYFLDNPDMVLGTMALNKRMNDKFGREDWTCCLPIEGADLAEQLKSALSRVWTEYETAEIDNVEGVGSAAIPADPNVRNFSYTELDGMVYYRENSIMSPLSPADLPAKTIGRVRGMIGLRDCVRELIDLQLDDYPEQAIREKQGELNDLYDEFTAEYGLIVSSANSGAFSDDSAYYLLTALEVLDEDGNLERKADMFTKRTINQKAVVTHVDTASEALAVSLGEKARVDMNFMAELTGKDEETLLSELRGVIFADYDTEASESDENHVEVTGRVYRAADEFLSGNVRSKLRKYQSALAALPPDSPYIQPFQDNVAALTEIQPKDLEPGEIGIRLGATWIDPEYINQFMYELLKTPSFAKETYKVLYHPYTCEWQVTGKGVRQYSNVQTTVTYGTGRMSAYRIIEDTLNMKDTRVYDVIEDADGRERRVLNKKETTLAQQKQEVIKQAFKDWIWLDPERRKTLVRLYNEMFNSTRPRTYDGDHILFSGINPEIKLLKSQTDGIARHLYGGNALYAHVVGAGKTFTMAAAAMEGKRLGLCQKTLIAVPNHLTEQWASEILRLYPAANILVAKKKDFEMRNRKKFCAKIATGEYDAVIIGQSQLEKIPMSQERQERLMREQIWEVEEGIRELKNNNGERFSIKQLERTKKSLVLRLTKLLENKQRDDVVNFEELGVDRLFVDEAHNFKNLFLYTKMRNVAGLSTAEAQKSSDLYMKCRYMDERTGNKGVVFATGTPISNSMTELYTMQRYLQHDALRDRNLTHFDAWASTFGETVTAIELAPEGTGYRARTRFAKFHNLPEMMAIFRDVADIQTADMLNLPVPAAHFENIVVEPSDLQKAMVAELSERAADVHNRNVKPEVDNMLRITTDGRKIGLDQRLINPLLPDFEGSKVNACTGKVFEIWNDTREKSLTQIIFCDFSTPNKNGRFNVYDDIRDKLVVRGIPESEIAFIHSANSEAKKKELFARVRQGAVRVLFGSTFMLGAGTNVQDRLIAIHDLDCPWRPADLEQRAGRIVRQGNGNPEVWIYRYSTSGTFDSYLWQTVEAKQKFIAQIMTSKSPVRACEDVDESVLSYAEIKALCAGNPLIAEKMNLDINVAKLRLLKSEYQRQHFRLEDNLISVYPGQISRQEAVIAGVEKDIEHYKKERAKSGEFPGITVMRVHYADKTEAAKALLDACKNSAFLHGKDGVFIGEYMGFEVSLQYNTYSREIEALMRGESTYRVEMGKDAFGNLTRMDNMLERLPTTLTVAKNRLGELCEQRDAAKEELTHPFSMAVELEEKEKRLAMLDAALNMDNADIAVEASAPKTEEQETGGQETDEPEIEESAKCGDLSIMQRLATARNLMNHSGKQTGRDLEPPERMGAAVR
jgi:N12 class adenine-specific DNA methylase